MIVFGATCSMKQGVFFLALLGLLAKAMAASPSAAASLNTERGYAIFQRSCLTCHGNPQFERAPSPSALREMTPEHIYDALTSGAMYLHRSECCRSRDTS